MGKKINILHNLIVFIQWQKKISPVFFICKYKPTLTFIAIKLFDMINNLLLMILPIKLLMVASYNKPSEKFPWLPIEEKNILIAIIFLVIIISFIISKLLMIYNKKIISNFAKKVFGEEIVETKKLLSEYYNRFCNFYGNLIFIIFCLLVLWFINKPTFTCLLMLPLSLALITKFTLESTRNSFLIKKIQGLAIYRTDIFIEIASSSIFIISFGVLVFTILNSTEKEHSILLLFIAFLLLRRGITSLVAITQNITFIMRNNIISKLEALNIRQLIQDKI